MSYHDQHINHIQISLYRNNGIAPKVETIVSQLAMLSLAQCLTQFRYHSLRVRGAAGSVVYPTRPEHYKPKPDPKNIPKNEVTFSLKSVTRMSLIVTKFQSYVTLQIKSPGFFGHQLTDTTESRLSNLDFSNLPNPSFLYLLFRCRLGLSHHEH